MELLIGTTFVIVLLAVLLLGIRVFFTKKGKFPNIHIGQNKAMRKKGIGCVTSQDKEAREQKVNHQ
ncbi:MAG: hypothetical protein EOM76_01985 [Sphingobacteriia bacterium]|jgi:hypothetical protein|nr:hypothetical protein [Paludibacteraceae bacterium]NCA78948.1 hypothetical protein [Sphingobacteriia bacterium]